MLDRFERLERPRVLALEEILGVPYPVLDHGFIRVIDYMGDDAAIVQAARVSYGRGTKKVNEDKNLINYLMRRMHTTPFEMCELKLHIKLPIFVARQWIRHRTANVNEYSARYSVLDREFYLPSAENLTPQSALNKQGRSEESVGGQEAADILTWLKEDADRCYQHYLEMLNVSEEGSGERLSSERQGISREIARINLPLSCYTQWYWKVDLHNLLHFLKLRSDPHAQYEIRVYAEEILKIVALWVPHTYDAFCRYQKGAYTLSQPALELVRTLLRGKSIDAKDAAMSKRELQELAEILGLDLTE